MPQDRLRKNERQQIEKIRKAHEPNGKVYTDSGNPFRLRAVCTYFVERPPEFRPMAT
ncbi:hypothetical protein [Dyadobacter sediminis]|uniref:hypothetical protein n=1 Tax=Dyadobacter sediminis TaxID=1493691 RepID=UPI001486C986|nr:hypothetical protein [Dyadobacter sediminis]